METKKLWTKNFTIITVGTIISAFGGFAMNIALSLVVFDNTNSTMLTGIYSSITILPNVILPIILAPYIDSHKRKNIIVSLDGIMAVIYILFGIYVLTNGFSYLTYMLFGIITGSLSAIYSTAYNALYPDLIPKGLMQKGYSVSSMIYPMVAVAAAPIAAIIYEKVGIHFLFFLEGSLLFLASLIEMMIEVDEKQSKNNCKFKIQTYKNEMLGGIKYLKKEKGIRNLYQYMAYANAAGSGNDLITMSYFQTASGFSPTMYSLLISAETIGRFLGGALQYLIKVPVEKRYNVTKKVYLVYSILDGTMLLFPYFAMIVFRFICGFLGVITATTREAAIQCYIPSDMRARINSVLHGAMYAGIILLTLLVGVLGEFLPFKSIPLIFMAGELMLIFVLIIKNKDEISKVLRSTDDTL